MVTLYIILYCVALGGNQIASYDVLPFIVHRRLWEIQQMEYGTSWHLLTPISIYICFGCIGHRLVVYTFSIQIV